MVSKTTKQQKRQKRTAPSAEQKKMSSRGILAV
jgi:hypothetical protein